MCPSATVRKFYRAAAIVLAGAGTLYAQVPEWRRVGNTVVDAGLAGTAGGAVDRVWYSPDGSRLFARLRSGATFSTGDFETWQAAAAEPPAPSLFRLQAGMTQFRGKSILGGAPIDTAVSPRDSDEIVTGNAAGVWRSLDGGHSWVGLNDALPNLPAARIVEAGRRTRLLLDGGVEAEWVPGASAGWTPTDSRTPKPDWKLGVDAEILVSASSGEGAFAGTADGRLFASSDSGKTWRPAYRLAEARVAALTTVPGEPRIALASAGRRVVRTMNGGLFWDDITANLPNSAVTGLATDLSTGAIYAAARSGLFVTYADLRSAAPVTEWVPITGLPSGVTVLDVKLDADGNQLFVLLEGHGVFATLAPHRFREPRVVNALDHTGRAAAPGTLLSVLGARLTSARSGNLEFPILASTDSETQLQVPFAASGTSLALAFVDSKAARREVQVPLRSASPAIFMDHDGTPILLDADRGVLIEGGRAVEAGSRIQILATGLGRVTPDWPTGLAAPADNPPKVVEAVRVFVDRQPVKVARATLAPGYVGFYLIEIELPAIVNAGPAELYVEAAGQQSGRVTLHLVQ